MRSCDVIVLGGGMAGMTAALQLHQAVPGLRIVILERNRFPVAESAFKVGESTVEVSAHYLSEVIGLRDHLKEHHLPKLGQRFFFGNGANEDIADRLEFGCRVFPPADTYQIARGRLENHLAERCAERGIALLDGVTIHGLDLGKAGAPHCVEYSFDGLVARLEGRWLVDTSGGAAFVKRKLGLNRPADHPIASAFLRVRRDLRVDDWSERSDWVDRHGSGPQRRLSVNHLMGDGYWVWYIPLGTGATSVGLVADQRVHPFDTYDTLPKLRGWLQRHEPQCERVLFAEDDVMDFHASGDLSTHCTRVFSPDRWFISGISGVFVDPFYSPGGDFIAYGNTLVTELIRRDAAGEPGFAEAVERSNDFFLTLSDAYFDIFRDKYRCFGNSRVMPLKICWDWSSYWTYNALAFRSGRFAELPFRTDLQATLKDLAGLNRSMQRLFVDWNTLAPSARDRGGYLDWLACDHLRALNTRLAAPGDGSDLARQVREGVDRLRSVSGEIVLRALRETPGLADRVSGLPRAPTGPEALTYFHDALAP